MIGPGRCNGKTAGTQTYLDINAAFWTPRLRKNYSLGLLRTSNTGIQKNETGRAAILPDSVWLCD